MSYTVTKLLTSSFYLSSVVGREFQTVSGDQLAEGLDLLNDVIGDMTVENDLIPYFNKLNFTAVPGQEKYFIQDLIQIETLTFFIESVRYSMVDVGRDQYFGSPRAENITSLPFTYHFEREFGGASVYMYFKPNQNYPLELWGQFRLTELSLNQDISLSLDRFYRTFLKYKVAERICHEYNYEIPVGISQRLEQYYESISKRSAVLDLTQNVMTTLDDNAFGLNYAIVNVSGGWVP